MRYGLLFLSLWLVSAAWGDSSSCFRFRVYLDGKGENPYCVDQPERFLSDKAIARREKYGVAITESDLPISPAYLDSLRLTGGRIVARSKWMRTVVVEYPDSLAVERLLRLSIVDSVKWVWKGTATLPPARTDSSRLALDEPPLRPYHGYAEKQIRLLRGDKLHKAGFWGAGLTIAILDAGFLNADRMEAFSQISICGTHNVVHPGQTVFAGDDHGTKVFSCLAANLPHVLVGAAPESSYWLLKCEETRTEFPIEEDYWAAAVEYADSVGADVISSSLGYFSFDDPSLDYTTDQLDGRTAFISRVASCASDKGLLVISSAGNEGNSAWGKITVPADAKGILTVGSVTEKRARSPFSSLGFTVDGRVKPDVVAMGSGCYVLEGDGSLRTANGTSFAAPILAGLVTCLWQALPHLDAQEIRTLVRQYASQFRQPDAELGYGIPNIYKSYRKASKHHGK